MPLILPFTQALEPHCLQGQLSKLKKKSENIFLSVLCEFIMFNNAEKIKSCHSVQRNSQYYVFTQQYNM